GLITDFSLVDFYGGLLANRLLAFFGDKAQEVKLSDLQQRLIDGSYPYPLFTAIDARSAEAHAPHWFEFSPHEIGSADIAVYVPTVAYGREFEEGVSKNKHSEVSLGFQLGTYGSAFGVHLEMAWQEVEEFVSDAVLKKFMSQLAMQYAGKRVFWAEVPNFMYGLSNNPWQDREFLKLVDAGLAFNFPYPPVSVERK